MPDDAETGAPFGVDVPVGFECKVTRIEYLSDVSTDHEHDSLWHVGFIEEFVEVGNGRRHLFMWGTLAHSEDSTWAQALITGRVRTSDEALEAKIPIPELVEGFYEEMYDTGRRAIGMLAALTDDDTPPSLPLKAPKPEVTAHSVSQVAPGAEDEGTPHSVNRGGSDG